MNLDELVDESIDGLMDGFMDALMSRADYSEIIELSARLMDSRF